MTIQFVKIENNPQEPILISTIKTNLIIDKSSIEYASAYAANRPCRNEFTCTMQPGVGGVPSPLTRPGTFAEDDSNRIKNKDKNSCPNSGCKYPQNKNVLSTNNLKCCSPDIVSCPKNKLAIAADFYGYCKSNDAGQWGWDICFNRQSNVCAIPDFKNTLLLGNNAYATYNQSQALSNLIQVDQVNSYQYGGGGSWNYPSSDPPPISNAPAPQESKSDWGLNPPKTPQNINSIIHYVYYKPLFNNSQDNLQNIFSNNFNLITDDNQTGKKMFDYLNSLFDKQNSNILTNFKNNLTYFSLFCYINSLSFSVYNDFFGLSDTLSGLSILNQNKDFFNCALNNTFINSIGDKYENCLKYLLLKNSILTKDQFNNINIGLLKNLSLPISISPDDKNNFFSLKLTIPYNYLINYGMNMLEIENKNPKNVNSILKKLTNDLISGMFQDSKGTITNNNKKYTRNTQIDIIDNSKIDLKICLFYFADSKFTFRWINFIDLYKKKGGFYGFNFDPNKEFIILAQYSVKITKWSPMSLIYFSKNFTDLKEKSKLPCNLMDTDQIPVPKQCIDIFNTDIHKFSKICNFEYNLPDRFNKLSTCSQAQTTRINPDDYLLLKTTDDCSCINNGLIPNNITAPIESGLCFTNTCTPEQRDRYKLNNINCKRYCRDMYQWIHNKAPMPQSTKPQHFSSALFNEICGENYTPFDEERNNRVLIISLISTLVICTFFTFFIFNINYKFFSKLSVKISLIVSLIILLGVTSYYLSLELAGHFECVVDENNPFKLSGSQCISKYLKIKIPNEFCNNIYPCECVRNLVGKNYSPECGRNCECQNTTCISTIGKKRITTTKKEKEINVLYFVFCIILSIFLPLIYIYAIKLYKFNINFYVHYSIITLLFLIPLFIFIQIYYTPVEKTKTKKNC